MLIDKIENRPHVEEPIFRAIKESSDPVVLWGAGEIAWCVWTYLRQHGIEPVCFCDNDPAKQGGMHLGLPVYDYKRMKEKFGATGGAYHIVVATGIQYKEPIFSQLKKEHEKNPVWYLRGFEVCGEKMTYGYVREYLSKFEEAYASLADDFSRRVFVNVLNAKISGDFNLYTEIMSQMEYFDNEVVVLSEKEVFLDVGAYKGKAVVEFAKLTKGNYEGIIAFEPDNRTFSALENAIASNGIQRVEIHNKGAWNKHEFMRFHDGREGGSRISENSTAAFPEHSIEVDAIDNVLQGRKVTYVAMDIEGAEHNAIVGAERTIKRWKPTLSVCVYHRREDLFDLLLLIKSFFPLYRFHVRHYTDNQTETVLYAIPSGNKTAG